MWTAIWTVAVFVLLLFLGDSLLAFAGEQFRERRAYRLKLAQEHTKQAVVAQQRDALIWRQLDPSTSSNQAPEPD